MLADLLIQILGGFLLDSSTSLGICIGCSIGLGLGMMFSKLNLLQTLLVFGVFGIVLGAVTHGASWWDR